MLLGLYIFDIPCRRGGSSGSARAWSLLSTACVPGSVHAIQLERKASTYACQRARARGGRQAAGRGRAGRGRVGSSGRGRVLPCSPAGAQVVRASFVRPGAPRIRSERPSSIARGAPPRGAVAESSRHLRPTCRQPTRLPPGARQRCGWRRSRAPGASHDCCGCAAAAVAPPRRFGCAGCSAALAPLDEQGEQEFARVSPPRRPRRRADQTVVWACSGATGGDYCSFARGQPR